MGDVEASKRFPFICLEKAISRAAQLYAADQRGNEMSNAGAFSVWGYSDKSSGGFQTVGALRAYGLLDGTEASKIKLSKRAFDYLRDEREDIRAAALKSFAICPPFLASLFGIWGVQPPSDTLARSYLKIERGLNEQSAKSLLSIYKDNLAFANLKGDDKLFEVDVGEGNVGGRDDPPTKIQVGDFVQWTSQGVDQLKPPRKVLGILDGFLQVHGSMSRIPMNEATVVEAPVPQMQTRKSMDDPGIQYEAPVTKSAPNDIDVLLSGKRLQITANVDAAGLKTLTDMIAKYQEILKLLN